MGVWGTAIFSNDEASDVKCEYTAIIGNGVTDEIAIKALKKYFRIKETLCEENADFWYALASLQHKYGRLNNEVRDNALQCIENRFTMDNWGYEKSNIKRQNILYDLKDKLLSDKQNPFRTPKYKREQSLGDAGDVLVYHLINYSSEIEINQLDKMLNLHQIPHNRDDLIRECAQPWFIGKYVLLCIAGVSRTPISKAIPDLGFDEYTVCRLYKWIGNEIPDISVTKNLEVCPWSKIKQKKGNYVEHFDMTFLPESKIRLKRTQYITNIGKTLSKPPVSENGVMISYLENELKCLFSNNKDIENDFKNILQNNK